MDRRWNPFYELIQQQDRISRLLDESLNSGSLSGYSLPATDVYEEDGKLVAEVSLPNFKEADIVVNLSDEGIEIQAEHTEEREDGRRKYLMHETSSDSFYRYINLPSGANVDAAKASFENGILRIEVPLQERRSTKQLTIGKGKDSGR